MPYDPHALLEEAFQVAARLGLPDPDISLEVAWYYEASGLPPVRLSLWGPTADMLAALDREPVSRRDVHPDGTRRIIVARIGNVQVTLYDAFEDAPADAAPDAEPVTPAPEVAT